ncbi:hypothetical protein [Saccharothrix coeruleofusca]|nr:hypothetical protein [Saccharothrix coeruleofusca]
MELAKLFSEPRLVTSIAVVAFSAKTPAASFDTSSSASGLAIRLHSWLSRKSWTMFRTAS